MKSAIALPLVVLGSLSSMGSTDGPWPKHNLKIKSSDFDLKPEYSTGGCTGDSHTMTLYIGDVPMVGSKTALQNSKGLYECFAAPKKRLPDDTMYEFTAWSSPDGTPRFEPSDDKTGEYVNIQCRSATIKDGELELIPGTSWRGSVESRPSLTGTTDMDTRDDGGSDEL